MSNRDNVELRRRRRRRRGGRGRALATAVLAATLLSISLPSLPFVVDAVEATWTPNPDDAKDGNAGPLPQSQNQRQMLSRLEDTIRSSPDPEGTLRRVAEQNNMSPEDLVGLLNRNRADMAGAAAGGVALSDTLPRRLARSAGALSSALSRRVAERVAARPRSTAFTVLAASLALYGRRAAPRTGLVLCSRDRHTTWLPPPAAYVRETYEGTRAAPSGPSSPRDDDDALATSVVVAAPSENAEATFRTAARLLADGRLTDTVASSDGATRLVTLSTPSASSKRAKKVPVAAVLVAPGLGRLSRFGVQPLALSTTNHNDDKDDAAFASYYTLEGGHFDGELSVAVERRRRGASAEAEEEDDDDDEENNDEDDDEETGNNEDDDDELDEVVVTVSLFVSKNGRTLSDRAANALVSALSSSFASSVTAEVRKAEARRSQAERIRRSSTQRAAKRRTERAENLVKREEMSADRRRRWQRREAGRYTPSGHRQRSPNNC